MPTDEIPPDLDEPQHDSEPGFTEEGYRDLVPPDEWVDPYLDMGGLARPDAYFGAKEFDCPACHVVKGEKCVLWLDLQKRWAKRHVPCLNRIQLAKKAGLI